MTVSSSTYIKDSVLYIRDQLRANITDPLSRSGSGSEWIFTAYPDKVVTYPIITVRKTGSGATRRLGHQSEAQWAPIPLEIRVWAKTVEQRDSLAQSVHNFLRTNQIGTGSSTEFEMFDFAITSSVPVDEEGEDGLHSEVMECSYFVILT